MSPEPLTDDALLNIWIAKKLDGAAEDLLDVAYLLEYHAGMLRVHHRALRDIAANNRDTH